MKRVLKLASNLVLPLSAVTETFAILARKDGGKTYCGLKSFEEMHAAGAQCVALDPVGKWWALRLAADGKKPGIDVTIFGGVHGDVPIEASAGALVAQVIVERGISAVIDVSRFEDRDMKRFVTDFARELYRLKQLDQSVIHIYLEEASTFLPQDKEDGADPPMLNAWKKIVRKGRNYGIGSTMIDQRAQDVNKKVLNQASILIVLGTSGTTDRAAVEKWVRDKHIDASGLDELASLDQGEAFVWMPRAKSFTKVKIAKRWTYDASRTPTLGKKRPERKLTRKDVTDLRTAMAETVKRAEENDPVELKKRIRELEAEHGKVMKAVDIELAKLEALKKAKAPLDERSLKRLEKAVKKMGAAAAHLEAVRGRAAQVDKAFAAEIANLRGIADNLVAKLFKPGTGGVQPAVIFRAEKMKAPSTMPGVFKNSKETNGAIGKGEAVILAACIQFVGGLRTEQIGVLTNYKATSRRTYLTKLAHGGYVENVGSGVYRATDKGRAALPNAQPLPTGEALREYWAANLPEGERVILDCLLKAYPNEVAREQIDEETGYKATSRRTYLTKLSARDLVTQTSKGATASAGLFD